MAEKIIIEIDKFVLFHKNRVSLLKEFAEKKIHGRLIFQVVFLGFESLAKLIYPEERDSGKRFISLLSIPSRGIGIHEATELYNHWRNSLTHQGFITFPWNTLEMWGEYDICFLFYPENKLRSSTEFPPESIIAIYDNLIDYLDESFKKKDINKLEFSP